MLFPPSGILFPLTFPLPNPYPLDFSWKYQYFEEIFPNTAFFP
jgi:hypothetical protein